MKVFLIFVIWMSTGGGYRFVVSEMPSWQECYKAVEAAQIHVATGGDAEGGMAAYCATEPHRATPLRRLRETVK